LENLPLVSYIITVLNGEKYIKRTLEGIVNQSYPNLEVIVVDNFSTDKTQEIVRSFPGVNLYLKGPERVSQLRYGLEKSQGKYIFTTGCDLVATKDYIRDCVNLCENSDCVAVYAGVKTEATNYWSKVKGLERECYIGDNAHEAARFLRKDVLEKMGGFDSELTLHGDDYEVQARLDKYGYKTGRIKGYELHIDEVDSIKEVFLKNFYYGMHSWLYIKKHGSRAVKQLSPIRKAFFSNYKLLLKHPLLTFGMIIFKIVQYSSATVGLVFGMFKTKKVSKAFHKSIYNKDRK
jgi:glycosyltransferase involved in cell wall biosynthesis